MSWNLGMVKARVRALLDDPQGSYCTDDFIVPLINETYNDFNTQMASTSSSWDIAVIEVPGVTAGTPNMSAYQAAGGLLENLTDQPLRIDWKPAGNPPSQYRLVTNYEVLPDIQPPQYPIGWEYRSQVIWLTPCTIDVDLRVRGEFGPAALTSDDSVLTTHPRVGFCTAYGTAALIAVVRGNDAWAKTYGEKAQEGIDEIMQEIVRSEQGNVRRFGSQTRRGGRGSFAGY